MTRVRNFEAEFCGKVPLNQTNLIQPHGVMLVVKKDDLSILQASENADVVFAKPAAELVKEKLSSFLAANDLAQLTNLFQGNVAGKLPFLFYVNNQPFLSSVEQQELFYVLEIEKEPHEEGKQTSFVTIYQDVKLVMAAIEACTTTDETCHTVAKELKKISGFDKVMVYCFDKDWNGDVVAEEMEEGMESYLGLKFPASDIPKQARDLYKKSPYRLIPTNNYEGVRLYPIINPLTNAFTDLSNSSLRSVAAVHLEYLRNMNVDASMSTRILKDGELWGLIACHHRTPKYLSYEMCSVFELLSNIVTAKIASMQNSDSFVYKSAKQELQAKVVESVLMNGSIGNEKETLLRLLDADGVAIVGNQAVDTAGTTPGRQEIEDLIFWLQANNITGLYQQTSLASVYEAAEAYTESGSGLLVLPVETEKGDFVLAFRGEAVQKIDWGGNPNEAVQFESDGRKYHPRASFRSWQQTVKGTAQPWRTETLEAAEGLRNFLIESRLNKKYFR
ncbi:MAG TPA: GAF domain-containing protein [Flavisolibacter sp.]|nr:GAF domain-containing protein [Flavisolibacter sp.]